MTISVVDKHIEIDPAIVGGKPHIKGHRITVQNIVIWHERMGRSADEIAGEYNLSLADIYAALSYYFDHQAEVNGSIRESETLIKEMRKRSSSVLEKKLSNYSE